MNKCYTNYMGKTISFILDDECFSLVNKIIQVFDPEKEKEKLKLKEREFQQECKKKTQQLKPRLVIVLLMFCLYILPLTGLYTVRTLYSNLNLTKVKRAQVFKSVVVGEPSVFSLLALLWLTCISRRNIARCTQI